MHAKSSQIRFFLLQNRQGKTRLSKWYYVVPEAEKKRIEAEVHRMVVSR
jgi:AP-2 complex subunit sigma-1